jgi:ribosomal protein S18 acetylase RimI-like enzyme
MHIERVGEVTEEIHAAICRLVSEIGTQKPVPTRAELAELVASHASTLWIARFPDGNGRIAGMLTLTLYRVPTGMRSIVEDVAVDPTLRRRGIARGLMLNAIEAARQAGAEVMALSSNRRREAANRMYQAMGFELRDTNAYLLKLK